MSLGSMIQSPSPRLIPGSTGPLMIEDCLNDQGCGYPVDDAAMSLTCVAGFVEDLVGFMGGEALVPEVDRQLRHGRQLRRKGLDLCGLGSKLAIPANWIAY